MHATYDFLLTMLETVGQQAGALAGRPRRRRSRRHGRPNRPSRWPGQLDEDQHETVQFRGYEAATSPAP